MNISTILDMAAEAFGERVGVVCGSQRFTYAQLREAALRAAAAIRASGAQYVAMLDVNSPAVPIAVFAAAYAGVPYVPLNYRLTKAELNELLARVTPACLIVNPEFRALVEAREGLRMVERSAFLNSSASEQSPTPAEDPRAVAIQLFTSGTTGKPKAAILRHENLMSYIVGTVEFGSAGEDDAALVTVPPYHIAGISAVLSATYAGRRSVQLESFDAAAWLEACRRESVTNVFLVPTMLARIVDHLHTRREAPKLPSLKAIAYGGGKMPLTTIQRAMKLFPGVDFANAYGLTETSSTICVLGPDDHRVAAASGDPKIRRRLASVGKATGAVEIQVRDESGRALGVDEAGLVYVRGGQVSGEYKLDKSAQEGLPGSQLDPDGWFCTRDRGFLDAEGFLFLDGRADDVIVRGGENISPGEIEEVLLAHPAVSDAAVVAMPDEQWGEGVAAAVVLRENARASAAELQEHVRARLRSSRVPQKIVFRDSLPYNETGKVLRRVIRQELAAAT